MILLLGACPKEGISNARFSTEGLINGQYQENTAVSITCNPGHTLLGEAEFLCQASGTYSEWHPLCPGIDIIINIIEPIFKYILL